MCDEQSQITWSKICVFPPGVQIISFPQQGKVSAWNWCQTNRRISPASFSTEYGMLGAEKKHFDQILLLFFQQFALILIILRVIAEVNKILKPTGKLCVKLNKNATSRNIN